MLYLRLSKAFLGCGIIGNTMERQNKNYRKSLFLAVFLCVSVFAVSSASAVESINDLTNKYDAKGAEIKAVNQIIDLKERQATLLEGQIVGLETQADKLQREIDVNKEKVNNLGNSIQSLAVRINEKETVITLQKKMLSELIRSSYNDSLTGVIVPIIFSSTEVLDYFRQKDASTETGDRLGDMLDSIKTLHESMVGERISLEEKKKEVDVLHIQLSEQDSYLEGVKSSKQSLLVKTTVEQKKYISLVKTLEEERQEIEDEINSLQSGEVASLSDADMPSFKKGLLIYPLKKFAVSQGYGMTAYAKKGAYGGGPHNGIDLSIPSGTPIYAPMAGKVVGVGSMYKNGRWYGYGRWIAIDHGNGMVTLYGHLSSQSVKKGVTVKVGEKIGAVGSTGYSTGSHLHFSVFSAKSYKVVPSSKVKGVYIPYGAHINPMKYLP